MNLTEERRQTHFSQLLTSTGQLFNISEGKKIDTGVENLDRECIEVGSRRILAHCESVEN